MGAAVGTIILNMMTNNYRMHNRSLWQWLAEAAQTLYTEMVPNYTCSVYYCDLEHAATCICSDCIYLPLTMLLEEYLEGNESGRWLWVKTDP